MIVILDLGGVENTELVRDIREMGMCSEIYPHDITASELKGLPNVKRIIISGDSNDVMDGSPIDVCPGLYGAGYPVMTAGHNATTYERSTHNWDEADSDQVLRSFVLDTCKAQPNWNMRDPISDQVELIRQQTGDRKVLLALSGGMDNSVVAALLIKAIGKQLTYVRVNHGPMRKGESESTIDIFKNQMDISPIYVDAADRSLRKPAGVADPEQKRKIIGAEPIRVFEEEIRKLGEIEFLARGAIYPDIVESGTKTIKIVEPHHNVRGLPEGSSFALVEPLRQLLEDEARTRGLELDLSHSTVYRQPFSGPRLEARCLGAITREHLEAVREPDAILREEFANTGLDKIVRQHSAIVPDLKSVGVKGNARCSDNLVIVRTVNTIDTMTASIERIDYDVLQRTTDRILKGVRSINRMCHGLGPKPMATIE